MSVMARSKHKFEIKNRKTRLIFLRLHVLFRLLLSQFQAVSIYAIIACNTILQIPAVNLHHTKAKVILDVSYLLCHKSSRMVLSVSRFKNHKLSMHRPAPEIWLHKTTEKVVQLKETTKVIAKEKETACYT